MVRLIEAVHEAQLVPEGEHKQHIYAHHNVDADCEIAHDHSVGSIRPLHVIFNYSQATGICVPRDWPLLVLRTLGDSKQKVGHVRHQSSVLGSLAKVVR